MKKLILLALLLVVGCDTPKNPTIEAITESIHVQDGGHTSITVYFRNHNRNNNTFFKEINTPEELADYKKQVLSLLDALDEAEKKMGRNEQ